MTEAREEVERRQKHFLELCVSTEARLNMMSDKDYALLELGVKKSQEPIGLSHTETRESGIRRAFVRLVAEKVLKAYNYVEVDACARVVTLVYCQLLHSLRQTLRHRSRTRDT